MQVLTEISMKKPIIRFNSNRFKDYIKATPRNYSVIVMFTAMAPQRQCVICKHASDEFTIVANSFRYSQSYSNKLFFGVVDFDEGSDIFQLVRIVIIKHLHSYLTHFISTELFTLHNPKSYI